MISRDFKLFYHSGPTPIKDKTPPTVEGGCIEKVNPHGNTIPGEERDKNGKLKERR